LGRRRAISEFSGELPKVVLEAGWRNDLENSCGRIASIPKRVPLIARLKDQVPGIAICHGIPEHRSDAPLKDETVFVLTMMSVHWRGQGARQQRVFHKSEAISGIVPVDDKPGASTS
jgi:hypothetical protein